MTDHLLAIDPGKKMACAVFLDAKLLGACFDWPFVSGQGASTITIELPQIYIASKSKGDPNDLIQLAFDAGQFAKANLQLGGQIITYKPQAWKGQLPKPIHHKRGWGVLTPAERAVMPPESLERIEKGVSGGAYSWAGHNLWDAVCLGLYHLGRLRK